jgi:tetratricopeptide (TPR) repeat protein
VPTQARYIRGVHERDAISALVSEFRDMLGVACEELGLTTRELRLALEADAAVTSTPPTIKRMFQGSFAFPRDDVRQALRKRLPERYSGRLDDLLDTMVDRIARARADRTWVPHGDPDRVGRDVHALLASGSQVVVGDDGSGRGTLARAAARFHAKLENLADALVDIDCGGREDGLALTPAQIIDTVFGALGGDLLTIKGTHERAAEITVLLRFRPSTIVLQAVAADYAEELLVILRLPPGRSRCWITTTPDGAPDQGFRLDRLDGAASAQMFKAALGDDAALGDGANELIGACSGLPVALRLAAHILASDAPLPEAARAGGSTSAGAARRLDPMHPPSTREGRAAILAGEVRRLAGARDGVLAALVYLGVQAAAPQHPWETRKGSLLTLLLETLAHAPGNHVYGDAFLAVAGLEMTGLHRVEAGNLLYRLERVGILRPLRYRSRARPGWELFSPLLRRAAYAALRDHVPDWTRSEGIQRLMAAFARRALDHSTPMTLPVGPWPADAGDGGPEDRAWYDRHDDELIAAARYASFRGLAEQSMRLVELVAGHLERKSRWAALDWLTGLVAEPLDPEDDPLPDRSNADACLRARIELLRGNVRHKVFRDFGEAADPAPGSARWHYRCATTLIEDDGSTRAELIRMWASAHEFRAIYSEPGKTVLRNFLDHQDEWQALEGRARAAVDLPEPQRASAFLLATLGRLHRRVVDGGGQQTLKTPLGLFSAAEERWHRAGDVEGRAYALNNRGRVRRGIGDFNGSLQDHADALSLFAGLGHVRGTADAHSGLARVFRHKGRLVEAQRHIELAIGLFDELGDERRRGDASSNRIRLLHEAGTVREALRHADSRTDYHRLPQREAAYAYATRARLLVDLGRYEAALEDYGHAERRWAGTDDLAGQAYLLHNRALLKALLGRPDQEAVDDAVRSCKLYLQITDPGAEIFAQASLAHVIWLTRCPPQPCEDWPQGATSNWQARAITILRRTVHDKSEVLKQLPLATALLHVRLAQYLAQVDSSVLAAVAGDGDHVNCERRLRDDVPCHVREATQANRVPRSSYIGGHVLLARALLCSRLLSDNHDDIDVDDLEQQAEGLFANAQHLFEDTQDLTSLADVRHQRAHFRARKPQCRRATLPFLNEDFRAVKRLHLHMGRPLPPCLQDHAES